MRGKNLKDYAVKGFVILVTTLLTACTSISQKELAYSSYWTHLELGAGNYGQEGHTQTSQKKTVLKELAYVSKRPTYVDQLPVTDKTPYQPTQQFAVLFWTLDQLVAKKGPQGIFYINDLYKDYAQEAAAHLASYAKAKNYNNIIIEVAAGDYLKLNAAEILHPYGKQTFDTVHLKNPEVSFYCYGMDGDRMLSSIQSRLKARKKLQSLANLSHNGLHFFPLDVKGYFIPDEEKAEFIQKEIFYLPVKEEWEPVPYVFPTGEKFEKTYGRVYFIKSHVK